MATRKVKRTKEQSYSEDNIQVFEGLQGVRFRASMYIGELGNNAIFHLIKEAVDNALDEYFAGRNKEVQVVYDNGVCYVHDSSQGIPVGKNKKLGISTLTALFTVLHAGGKFDNKAFKVSAGTHGVGNKTITALSTSLDVWTYRDKEWYHQQFGEGEVLTKVSKKKPPVSVTKALPNKARKGTILMWKPDLAILGKTAKLNFAQIETYLQSLCYLNRNFKITLKYVDGKNNIVETYENKIGPAYFITEFLKREKYQGEGEPLVVESDNFDLAFQLSDYSESDGIYGYVNSSLTAFGGMHVDGFWDALVAEIKPYAKKSHVYRPRDLRYGLIGYINLRVSGPKFSSQTKEKLVGFAIDSGDKVGQLGDDLELELSKPAQAVERHVRPLLKKALAKNKKLAAAILNRATSIASARLQSTELMKAASKLKVEDKADPLPDVLYTATKAKPHERELFIVEGDSAGGCFVGSTPIIANGVVMTYEELVEAWHKGEHLFSESWDVEEQEYVTGIFDEPRVTKFTKDLIAVNLNDGSTYKCTNDHPWLLHDGKTYVRADQLADGTVLKSNSMKLIAVTNTEKISLDEPVPVYDATVSLYSNYSLGNGVVVHNTAKYSRYKEYQEVLKLKGKPLNSAKATALRMAENESIRNMLVAIGYKEDAKSGKVESRVNNVYFLSDPDPDGYHINQLGLTALWKAVPQLFREGRVRVVIAPLYTARYKGKTYFAFTLEEIQSIVPNGAANKTIKRIKGWGEASVEELRAVAFDPAVRKVLIVMPPKNKKDEEFFFDLVGEGVATRRNVLGL